jgi:prepilin-type processing-associated H-X9-DG protein
MIAESAVDTTYSLVQRQWTDYDLPNTPVAKLLVTANRFGFVWAPRTTDATPIPNPVIRPVPGGRGALLPIHSGVVNVTFCDGHTEQVSDDPDTTCDKYDWTNLPISQ